MTPYFDSLDALVAMGGHGVYVWTCWGLVLAAVLFGIWQSLKHRKHVIRQLRSRKLHQKNKKATKGGL